jgi:hypothetical protein
MQVMFVLRQFAVVARGAPNQICTKKKKKSTAKNVNRADINVPHTSVRINQTQNIATTKLKTQQ